ncbi:SDR family oxidoreductase [Phytoactinopolyspora mesophila]|uniref:SDR family NAD(P)-dependent oxidoreductase n=1 Tax=Phytoactinopolyspora mesophila TaxID=2650750 RepID=A0A7K3LXY1_9ACTN|nr:SDR family oxidoreductase [Phytoactinopolyspora mesophila]NDL55891.1 SDR family NAD(P)-dependent oxidoreductase [Phytoactinopolyspora mesophila]
MSAARKLLASPERVLGRSRNGSPKTVVVTGASAGIGRATAHLFGARGDRVALLARGRGGLRAAADDVVAAGGKALPIEVDVTDYEAVDNAATEVESEFGPIDVWVNNAFVAIFAPFTDIDPDEFRRVTDVTYHGYVHGTRAALDRMLPRDHGTIVQVGSALAYRGIPLQSAYCGAKHAMQGFTESLRCELLHERRRVRVTMVQLPGVNTPQFEWALSRMEYAPQPVPPIYSPRVAAQAVVHAADHPHRREYGTGFSAVATMTANKIAPGLLDRYLARTAYDSQQTGHRVGPERPVNLWEPADHEAGSDFGAHGPFSSDAKDRSPQLWLSQRRGAVSAAAAGLLVLGGSLIGKAWRNRS